MAISFVTRFRRQLAAIPFVLVLIVPMSVVTWVWLDRRGDSTDLVDVPQVEVSVEGVCVEAEAMVNPEHCNFGTEFTSSE